MGRVLLKACMSINCYLLSPPNAAFLGYHPWRQWVSWSSHRSRSVPCLYPILKGWKDFTDEPICQQALQQSVQGHYRRRFVRFSRHIWVMTPLKDCLFSSLTKEVMVDDRLVTMQVCAPFL